MSFDAGHRANTWREYAVVAYITVYALLFYGPFWRGVLHGIEVVLWIVVTCALLAAAWSRIVVGI